MSSGSWSGALLHSAGLAIIYVLAGRLGLSLDPVGGFATLVWPPAGVALAALLLVRSTIWPGVTAGALIVNLITGAPFAVAAAIAVGNTLEAVIGTHLLRRVARFEPSLPRLEDVLALALMGALSATVAASIGVWALTLGGIIGNEAFGAAWLAWWLGDTVGILGLTPLILVWTLRRDLRAGRTALVEFLALIVVTAAMSLLIFGTPRISETPFWQAYLLSPLLMWAALRFYQIGAATVMFLISAVAIWGTVFGLGPFTADPLYLRLEELQIFLAITTLTFLVLGVVSAERKANEAQLILARDLAEAASRAKSQFLAVTSHELRTPLTGIVGYADLLETGVAGPVSHDQQAKLARIKVAAWHLVGIIENILSFSRAEAGREDVTLELTDCIAVARDCVALVEPAAAAKGLSVSLHTSESRLTMRTDARKLSQILVNVLGNAVKFSSAGTVDLTIEYSQDWVSFRVRDDGPGIAPEDHERIFEPFTQVDQSSTRPHGGTGLGLSVARAFAEMLGGAITVESAHGRGSTFVIRLPLNLDTPVDRHTVPDPDTSRVSA